MALADNQIRRLNAWWADPSWIDRDPHLAALREQVVDLPAPGFVAGIALDDPAIHTVRGPRQVGKSTSLKQLARRVLEGGLPTP